MKAFLSVSHSQCQHCGSVMISFWQTGNIKRSCLNPQFHRFVSIAPWHQRSRKWTSTSLFLLSSGGAVPVNGAVGLRGVEASQPSHALSLFPFVRVCLSPSPAVKGRIVAPAASLVLMSPDANLTHGCSLNNHFLYPFFLALPLRFLSFLLVFFHGFFLSFFLFFVSHFLWTHVIHSLTSVSKATNEI